MAGSGAACRNHRSRCRPSAQFRRRSQPIGLFRRSRPDEPRGRQPGSARTAAIARMRDSMQRRARFDAARSRRRHRAQRGDRRGSARLYQRHDRRRHPGPLRTATAIECIARNATRRPATPATGSRPTRRAAPSRSQSRSGQSSTTTTIARRAAFEGQPELLRPAQLRCAGRPASHAGAMPAIGAPTPPGNPVCITPGATIYEYTCSSAR